MRRCTHGVYNPDADSEKAYSCGSCYPEGHPENKRITLQIVLVSGYGSLEQAASDLHQAYENAISETAEVVCIECGCEFTREMMDEEPECPECGSTNFEDNEFVDGDPDFDEETEDESD